MKKFENIISVTLLTLISSVILVIGCQKNNKQEEQKTLVYESESKVNYDVNDTNQLKTLVKKLANENGEIQILKAAVQDITDQKGNTFKAIVTKYRFGDELTNMVVPLITRETQSTQSAKGDIATTFLVAPCEMKCTSAWGCSECTQTIIEQCKSQTCTCTSGNGGCSSKITFPE